jgi:hypothetical protein
VDRPIAHLTKCRTFPWHRAGKQAVPIGQIDLPVTFGDRSNFRMEMLTFEVVDFCGAYHAILCRLCYTYLYLKVPGPRAVIVDGHYFSF